MSTTATGQHAEQKAAEYLARAGFMVLARNWKRQKLCEIDIVAQKGGAVYFVEVKYRADNHFGGGLDYIASQKLRHMRRAARVWVGEHNWAGEYTLAAVEVTGDFVVTDFIESIE